MSIGGDGYGEHDRAGEDGPSYGRGTARFTTRTRLPEGEGAPARPSGAARGPGRSVVTIVAVVVLLMAAIAFANRGGGGGGTDDAAKNPQAQPTAPSGDKPVENTDGKVPSGFPHSEKGAQSAAANYAVALGGDGMYRGPERQKIVEAVYAPSVRSKSKAELDTVYSDPGFLKRIGLKADGTAPHGATFISRTNPVGSKVEKYSDSSAKVSVWYSSLFGIAGEGSTNPVTESWYTNTFDLSWVDGGWKVTDFQQKDGPAPVGKDQKASPADEMAGAVEGYGGFTYAR
ncbi:hypothetical protein [Streptomyces sp. ODS28]|uniref:hypothetical protein n=1 Tax=Streptomyces sp. ODS28 TaxID=3136688 RepID=UPI0031ED60CB